MRWTKVVALAAAGSLSLAACGGGSSDSKKSTPSESIDNKINEGVPASAGMDPKAQGPAPAIDGAKKGGTLTLNVNSVPESTDPSSQYYQDTAAIMRLTTRTLTTYRMTKDGKSVLVPDMATDLGQKSKDGLTWTFTLKPGLKYEDGTPIKATDVAYSVKRSFAQEELPGGPTFQLEYFKDGDKYKGPWKSGEKYDGIVGDDSKRTVTIKLAKKMETLPYFASFTMFGGIPKAKDTKTNYQLKWLSTGPYKIKQYTKGSNLTLVKNTNWDPKTDAARQQLPDTIAFNFGKDNATTAKSIMADNGTDQTTLSYDGVDASILQQARGPKKNQVATGASPCVSYITMDTTIPMPVKKAIAVAWPYDQLRIAGGATSFDYAPATTFGAPQIPGFKKYTVPGFTGTGKGDPKKAKEMLAKAGKPNFELQYYYVSDDDAAKKVETVRKPLLEAAGFKVKSIPVSKTEYRKKRIEPNHNINLMQGTRGWCYDWPSGDSIYPPLFNSTLPLNGGVGNIKDKALDKEMASIAAKPVEEQGALWSSLDKKILEKYLPALPVQYDKGSAIFGSKVHNVKIDPNAGMPDLTSIWVG